MSDTKAEGRQPRCEYCKGTGRIRRWCEVDYTFYDADCYHCRRVPSLSVATEEHCSQCELGSGDCDKHAPQGAPAEAQRAFELSKCITDGLYPFTCNRGTKGCPYWHMPMRYDVAAPSPSAPAPTNVRFGDNKEPQTYDGTVLKPVADPAPQIPDRRDAAVIGAESGGLSAGTDTTRHPSLDQNGQGKSPKAAPQGAAPCGGEIGRLSGVQVERTFNVAASGKICVATCDEHMCCLAEGHAGNHRCLEVAENTVCYFEWVGEVTAPRPGVQFVGYSLPGESEVHVAGEAQGAPEPQWAGSFTKEKWGRVCVSPLFQYLKHGRGRIIIGHLLNGDVSLGWAAQRIVEDFELNLPVEIPKWEGLKESRPADNAKLAEKIVNALWAYNGLPQEQVERIRAILEAEGVR